MTMIEIECLVARSHDYVSTTFILDHGDIKRATVGSKSSYGMKTISEPEYETVSVSKRKLFLNYGWPVFWLKKSTWKVERRTKSGVRECTYANGCIILKDDKELHFLVKKERIDELKKIIKGSLNKFSEEKETEKEES